MNKTGAFVELTRNLSSKEQKLGAKSKKRKPETLSISKFVESLVLSEWARVLQFQGIIL